MSTIENEIGSVLSQIRALSDGLSQQKPIVEPGKTDSEFGAAMKNAIDSVSNQQQSAESTALKFQSGDPNTSIAEVVVSMQKASISFQAMAEARNRVVEAYREIMNMSV